MSSEWMELGFAALERGAPGQALAHFHEALHLAPRSAQALFGQGLAQRALGALGEAEESLILAVEADGEHIEAWIALVELEQDGGAWEVARENLSAALRAHPGHPSLLALRLREASAGLSDALDDVLVQLRHALLLRDRAAARVALHALEASAPDDPRTWAGRGEMFLVTERGDRVALIHALTKIVRHAPHLWEPRAVLGRILLRKGPLQNVRMALAYAEDAWRISGELPAAGIGLVEAWTAAGKKPFAEALCRRLAGGDTLEAGWARIFLADKLEGGAGS